MTTKSLHIRLPRALYDEFYKAYPGRGERSRLVEQFVFKAIELSRERERLIDRITKEVIEDASRDYCDEQD